MIALSTAEAELQAMAVGMQLALAFQDYVLEFGIKTTITIRGDNQAAIALVSNGGTWRSRYYMVKAAALRQAVKLGLIKLEFVKSAD
jgi:hypothetical protein